MRLIRSLAIAFSTYSRIPMPQVEWSDENRKYTMCFFPLIGAVIGLLLGAWLWLCDVLAIGAVLRGAVGALLPLLVTGGIHMDGFMDTMDAMASWQTRARRLEILKDSHTGAFA
ncbi:MAG: adenosylcobinamide-GDP ribazoletransferase, partial [Clostridia bacterium]|nr:adenosylcobinamide-GDP ribazoletransferase [Clostridia bacterium]